MNLIFISPNLYPNGGAASNRHLAYAKGLVENNHKVTFLLLHQDSDLFMDGIRFISVSSRITKGRKGLIGKAFYKLDLIRESITISEAIHRQEHIDAVILLDTEVKVLLALITWAKRIQVKVLHERTEYPFVVKGKGFRNSLNLFIYTHFILGRFDGIFVINKALKSYFSQLVNHRIPVEIINMIVDPGRFAVSKTASEYGTYIAYAGSLEGDKDGIGILIRAFAVAKKKGLNGMNLKLLLIGDISNPVLSGNLEQLCTECECSEEVVFTGKVDRAELPGYLRNATALALARPANKQAEGGFPTKLGEYLATGNPVIITNTGEIGEFLIDGIHAFIAIPGSISSFSDKIVELFSDHQKAAIIGAKGRELVEKEFNYLFESEKLARFIMSIQ